ncbi:MAG: SDR family oxidoreductase [Chloroflexi bacterium]|nr:SDR family oxidoreductase [Chloroflexota bacterium]
MGNPAYIVTGANAGIGKAIAQGLAERGLRVIILCRNPEKGARALDEIRTAANNASVELVIGDLSSSGKVRSVAERLLDRVSEIGVLINNAGVWPTRLEHNEDGIEISFAVNHLAPFLLAHLILERLKENGSGRIVNVSASLSAMGKIDLRKLPTGEDFSPFRTYANTKLCNVLFTREFARRSKGSGVTINAVYPGVVRSNLVSNVSGLLGLFLRLGELTGKSPAQGAEGPTYLATSNEVSSVTGSFFDGRIEVPYAKNALDDGLAAQLWEKSEILTRLR